MAPRCSRVIVFCTACTLVASFLSSFVSSQQATTALGPLSNEGDSRLVASDKEKRVRLTFREQEWLPALKWLADELRLNLDWQLLPTDTFSLHSTQEYSLKEAEDLINMQLLARGFTLLKRGEVLRVCPLKDMDITLVPHVEAEDLAELSRHQFARVSFSLDWMIAEQAAIEFKPLMSPFGKLFPMISSNRLEAMDAVVNLRELNRLLNSAETDDARRERVAEFKLVHRRAEEVALKVRQLVGLPSESTPTASSQTQLDIEQAKFKVEAVKQMGANATEVIKDRKQDVFLVVNDKENSILVNAPPNKMEVIRQAITAMDKVLTPTDSTWETVSRVKVHEVSGFDPDAISKLLTALQERGNLAKDSRIQHEAAYNRIIAFASPEDHLTISQVIDSFRAQKRTAAVLPLASIDPVYAVKAVQVILKSPERPSSRPGVASDGKFQIEADPEHRRLLLWATEDELSEVRNFLKQLGEDATLGAATSQLHVISLNGGDAEQITNRFLNTWKNLSDTPVHIDNAPANSAPQRVKDSSSVAPNGNSNIAASDAIEVSRSPALGQIETANVRFISRASAGGQGGSTPVRIVQGENGDLIVMAHDPVVAETAKRLLQQFIPSPSELKVIYLKHSSALLVKRQLESMLLTTITGPPSKLVTTTAGTVTIEVDQRANRLLIQNASAKQLRLIENLIPTLDQAAPDDVRLVRKQKVHRFKNRKASEVLAVIKDVYRDLLSTNDRSYSSSSSSRSMNYNRNIAATISNPEYQGILSVGIDEEANLLIISAPTYLIDEICELATTVDTQTDGRAVSVVPFNSYPADTKARDMLSKIFSEKRR